MLQRCNCLLRVRPETLHQELEVQNFPFGMKSSALSRSSLPREARGQQQRLCHPIEYDYFSSYDGETHP